MTTDMDIYDMDIFKHPQNKKSLKMNASNTIKAEK